MMKLQKITYLNTYSKKICKNTATENWFYNADTACGNGKRKRNCDTGILEREKYKNILF